MTLSELLSARRQELLERWAAAANSSTSAAVSRVELMDRMPQFVDELIDSLAAGVKYAAPLAPLAEEHGSQRLRLGFDIGEVVREYDLLHQVVFDLAAEAEVAIDPRSARLLASQLAKGTRDAVTQYHYERDAELQRQGAQHLGFVAHELRNPLSSAVMAYALVRRTHPSPSSKALLTLGRALGRLTETIDGALAHARLKVGGPLNRERVDIRALIEEIAADLGGETEEKGTVIAVDAEAVVTQADPRLLGSALSNLMRNAVKFSRDGATVHVRAFEREGRVRIEVEDECGGLPPGTSEELFSPFVQKGADRTGFGLGLAITRQAIESHNGLVDVRNLPGRGCIFTIVLPSTLAT